MPLGLYISVPFCRTKCSYCNFASDVFSRAVFQHYVDRVCSDIEHAEQTTEQMGGRFFRAVDSVYLGGGTPTVLDITQLERLFVTISQNFQVQPGAEVTVECAPGTLTPPMVETLQRLGVNRVSLGVQSFVDQEAASVGRLHNRATVVDDIARLRAAGIANINVDLIAGLPHQNAESWASSLNELIASGVPHASVYMLEVDEDSRLGRELIAGGTRYHAHFVPDEDLTADLYGMACERLNAAGVRQYEISNFARGGWESRHNLKYWTRQPYLGFGVDAHSMIESTSGHAVRYSTPDSLEQYVGAVPMIRTDISARAALEETFFLGLRLNRGVDLQEITRAFGHDAAASFCGAIAENVRAGLLEHQGERIRLTPRGRLLSNEVFQSFLSVAEPQP
jgi:oxygen-independent coproporphyrinogen-3 oxidase